MAKILSREEIVLEFLEVLRLTRPDLATAPGAVSRDLIIDPVSEQLETLYESIQEAIRLTNINTSRNTDLDNFAFNYGLNRIASTKSSGTVLLTISEFIGDVDIPIGVGSLVATRSGISFNISGTFSIKGKDRNLLAATAAKFRPQLDSAGITDAFAFEVPIESTSPGTLGNVAPFTITTHNISGIGNVVNLEATTGGADLENDNNFRNRIRLAVSGNNVGTDAGYRGLALSVTNVKDAFVAGPGNPLQLRDETIVFLDKDNQLQIQQEGIGGTVDIFILGQDLITQTQSFVFNDQSGTNDATNSLNDIILGQFNLSDLNLTLSERRINALATNQIPLQPVDRVVSITGSVSGPNFVESFVDEDGNVKGNFQLIKDESTVGGSAFARDKIHFISNEIELENEDETKGDLNAQDALQFTDVNEVVSVIQNVDIQNEHSRLNNLDRSLIIPRMPAASDVTRVFNLTTGERYVITKQPTATDNTIQISGNNLPVSTDILQVDYIFAHKFDRDIDYAHSGLASYVRPIDDAVDWSRSNVVEADFSTVQVSGPNRTVTVVHPVSSAISVKNAITDVELFAVSPNDGSFNNNIITLPSTSSVPNGTDVKVLYIADRSILLDTVDIADIAAQTVNNLTVQPTDLQTDGFGSRYLRYAPTYLSIDVSDISDRGSVAITGNSFEKIEDVIFTVSASQGGQFKQDLSNIIRNARGVSSTDPLTNISIAKVLSVENLTRTSSGSPYQYDLTGYKLKSNAKDLNAIQDITLLDTEFVLPSTGNNLSFVPSFNDKLRITCYFSETNRIEIILFSQDGQQFTSKPFFLVSNIAVSGFADPLGTFNGSLSILASNQPQSVTVYQSSYNYVAPKENERLQISFAYNKIIGDVTSLVEANRPVTADVLSRESFNIPVNVTVSIITEPNINVNVFTLTQDIQNSISDFLSASELGTTIDSSDIVNNVYNTVSGIDRLIVTLFERQDSPGNTLSISALDNQAITPGIIKVVLQNR